MFSPLNSLAVAALALLGFVLSASGTKESRPPDQVVMAQRVVVSAPVQIVLYGGDRFLAANFETVRASATGMDIGQINLDYLLRAQNVASELNPCHEDNYHTANAFLTWIGGEKQAGLILNRATKCRFWDEMPPFYLGFNQYFFHRNYVEAHKNIELAASRSMVRASSFSKLAIVIKAESFKNERLALDFLIQEKDKTTDPKLRKLLEARAERLTGLLALRDAQDVYESRTGAKLESPTQLLELKILKAFPKDPTNIGYRFLEGRFQLNEVTMR